MIWIRRDERIARCPLPSGHVDRGFAGNDKERSGRLIRARSSRLFWVRRCRRKNWRENWARRYSERQGLSPAWSRTVPLPTFQSKSGVLGRSPRSWAR